MLKSLYLSFFGLVQDSFSIQILERRQRKGRVREELFLAFICILRFTGLMSDLHHPELRKKGTISVGLLFIPDTSMYKR